MAATPPIMSHGVFGRRPGGRCGLSPLTPDARSQAFPLIPGGVRTLGLTDARGRGGQGAVMGCGLRPGVSGRGVPPLCVPKLDGSLRGPEGKDDSGDLGFWTGVEPITSSSCPIVPSGAGMTPWARHHCIPKARDTGDPPGSQLDGTWPPAEESVP